MQWEGLVPDKYVTFLVVRIFVLGLEFELTSPSGTGEERERERERAREIQVEIGIFSFVLAVIVSDLEADGACWRTTRTGFQCLLTNEMM